MTGGDRDDRTAMWLGVRVDAQSVFPCRGKTSLQIDLLDRMSQEAAA